MAGRIPESFIQDLLGRVDIVDVVQSRLPLKKKGKDYWACCPFHGEKSPSFSVSQSKQFYKCFGCGVSGNVVGFVMAYDRIEFPAAIEALAERAGIEVPREDGGDPQAALRKELYTLLAEVSLYFQKKLRESEGAPAVAYLKKRGVTGEVAKRYGLGYAPAGWDGLLKALGTSTRQRELLEQAGMLVRREAGEGQELREGREHYDRFRERVMFPIRDARGRTIGFGGRVMGQGEPKYLNSPETPVFHKGFEVYGLFEAKQEKASSERLLLVEGYMDVVALAQYGIGNAVAALGTAATEKHFETLFRYAPEVVCCFDGDKAGRGAAWRALQNALPMLRDGRQVKFLFLPDDEDPDSLVRKEGCDAFQQRISEQSLSLSEYLFRELETQTDIRTPEGRARLASLAKPLISKAADPLYRALLEQVLAEKVGLPMNTRGPAQARRAPPVMEQAPPDFLDDIPPAETLPAEAWPAGEPPWAGADDYPSFPPARHDDGGAARGGRDSWQGRDDWKNRDGGQGRGNWKGRGEGKARGDWRPREREFAPRLPQPRVPSLVHQALGLLLQHPQLVDQVPMGFEIEIMPLDRKGVLAQLISLIRIQPGIATGQLLAAFSEPEVAEGLTRLAGWDHHVAEDNLAVQFRAVLDRLLLQVRTQGASADKAGQLEARIKAGIATAEEKAEFAALLKHGRT